MKKSIAMLLLLACTAALAGCGRMNSTQEPEQQSDSGSLSTAGRPGSTPGYATNLTSFSILLGPGWVSWNGGLVMSWNGGGKNLPGAWAYQVPGGPLATKFGTGQCPSVPELLAGAPVTSKWRMGRHVIDGGVGATTAIATFTSTAAGMRYTGDPGHCGLLVKVNPDKSITLWDQNYPKVNPLSQHTIPYHPKNGTGGVGDSDSYYVIIV
jgi:hypothetical protein